MVRDTKNGSESRCFEVPELIRSTMLFKIHQGQAFCISGPMMVTVYSSLFMA